MSEPLASLTMTDRATESAHGVEEVTGLRVCRAIARSNFVHMSDDAPVLKKQLHIKPTSVEGACWGSGAGVHGTFLPTSA